MMIEEKIKEALRQDEELPECCRDCQFSNDESKCEVDMHDISQSIEFGFISYQCPIYRIKIEEEISQKEWKEAEILFFGADADDEVEK